MKLLLVAIAILTSNVFAQEIFLVKKSMRPKNVLHFTAKVEACKLKSVDNHWIMGETDGHREAINSSERPYFLPKVTYSKDTELDFTMGAMERMAGKLEDTTIRVRLVNCVPKAYIDVNRQEIQLQEIYASVGLLMNVKSLTIKGIGPNGAPVSKTINN